MDPFRPALQPWLWALALLFLLGVLLWAGLVAFTRMPGSSFSGPLPPLTAEERYSAGLLEKHTAVLARDIGPRNIWRPASLNSTVQYLEKLLHDLGYAVHRQKFNSYDVPVVNLEVEIAGNRHAGDIIVIGAHYDSVEGSPGANDNGSGVAVLLEIARLLSGAQPQRAIRLVFFANEEPPFYCSWDMGSRHYARQARERGERIAAMLSLETVGCYKPEAGSQRYPFPFSLFYPKTADFIAFVGNHQSRLLVRRCIEAFRRHARLPSEGIAAPGFVTGIGWSDHWSFWQEGYPALMVTDTAFFRSADYHTAGDTPEKLDYGRMARLVSGLAAAIREVADRSGGCWPAKALSLPWWIKMKKHICNSCGCGVPPGGLFYRCRTEIISGFDNYIPDEEEDGEQLVREACANMSGRSPEELAAQVYEEISFILCPVCRQKIRKQLLALKANRTKPDKILLFPPRPG